VGHSYGGLLALRLARRDPARVRSLTVYDPVAFGVLARTDPDETEESELRSSGATPGETEGRAARESRMSHRDPRGHYSESAQDRLRAWVESKYTHMPLRDKDAGTKLDKLHGEYARSGVHARPLGRNKFAAMLSAVYPGIGPHKNSPSTVSGLYLLRVR
jgi:pimeloyl-ACP methyl ester carboxylesterase